MRKIAVIPMLSLALALGIVASPALAGSGGNSFSNGLGEFMNCLVRATPRQVR